MTFNQLQGGTGSAIPRSDISNIDKFYICSFRRIV